MQHSTFYVYITYPVSNTLHMQIAWRNPVYTEQSSATFSLQLYVTINLNTLNLSVSPNGITINSNWVFNKIVHDII